MLSLWVAAWLYWFFEGELRHALFAFVFPAKWRAGHDKEDITHMTRDEFDIFLAASSNAPGFFRGLFSCPGCLSAYVSAVGTLLLWLAFGFNVWTLPLLWGGAAYVGHRTFHHL